MTKYAVSNPIIINPKNFSILVGDDPDLVELLPKRLAGFGLKNQDKLEIKDELMNRFIQLTLIHKI